MTCVATSINEELKELGFAIRSLDQSYNIPAQSGCGALCPSYNRGCYGCYGPKENANPAVLTETLINAGNPVEDIVRLYKNFNADSEPFRRESQRLENGLAPHDNQGN